MRHSSSQRTACGRYDAGATRHSVGGKVAGDASLWKCCNPDTAGGKRRWLSPDCRIEPFASCSVLPIRGPSVAPRTKAPAARGFRLLIFPTIDQTTAWSSAFERLPAIVRGAVALDLGCWTTRSHVFSYHRCKPGEHKASQHPAAEAAAEDKQFLVDAVPAAGEQP